MSRVLYSLVYWFVVPCVHPFVTKLKESFFSCCLSDSIRGCVPWSVSMSGTLKILDDAKSAEKGFLTITAPAWPQYSPRPPTYCPYPLALLPLPTSSDY